MDLIIDQRKEALHHLGQHIGETPLFELDRFTERSDVRLFAKLEWQQFGGSVKARPAYRIFREAVENGSLDHGRHLLDASSGNTAIAYASVGAAIGIPVTICLPGNASSERKKILKSLGAEVIETSPFGGTDDAQDKAAELAEEYPDRYLYVDQYSNEYNWKAHYSTTAEEIHREAPEGPLFFVAALGTTGTFTGTVKRLKELRSDVTAVALQPASALHGLEGWKHLETVRTPAIFDRSLIDEGLFIETETAYQYMVRAAREEGLLISPSSAAALAGAHEVASNISFGTVVTVFPDNAEKYGEITEQVFA